jgi:hypothetical protein
MGKIQALENKVIVEFSVSEIILERAAYRQPDGKIVLGDYIGNMIARAAWRIIMQKAKKYVRQYDLTKVEGDGRITITFEVTKELENAQQRLFD